MESLVKKAGPLQSFYDGKKVFLTGHTGFKGVWLTAMLHRLGAVIKGYALEPEESKPFYELFDNGGYCKSIIADIRDRDRLVKELVEFQPDYIFHLAAQPLVLRSYEIPAETFEVNVAGTANLLEAATHVEKRCSIVVVTTDKVYENKEIDVLYDEDDRLGGYDPYSASKACTELVVDSFRSSFFNIKDFPSHQKAIASARAGNVIGGGDWSKNRIVPDIARALLDERPIQVRNPGSVRPWQHVLEPLYGYLLLNGLLYSDPKLYARAYNFGPSQEDHLKVEELVRFAIEIWGAGNFKTEQLLNKPHEAKILQLNINRAFSELGWKPKLNARQALTWALQWYRTEKNRQAEFTFEQIDNYLANEVFTN